MNRYPLDTKRHTYAEETDAIAEYLGFPRRSELKVRNDYICFEKDPEFQNEKQFPLRIRRACLLLPDEILFRSEIVQLINQSGQLQVGFRAERAEDCGARMLETSNFLAAKEVSFNDATLMRLIRLMSYRLDSDPFMSSFVSAHNSLPNSVFRIVTYMAIVEGLVGADKEIGQMRENIASKMLYFFHRVWPNLDLAADLPGPQYSNGRDITDIEGAWNDLYRLRNLIVRGEGDILLSGVPLKQCVNSVEFIALQDIPWHQAFEILEFGLKALLYWQLEDPAARHSFSQIV